MSMAAVAVRNQRKKQKGTPGGHTTTTTSGPGSSGPGRASRGPSLPTAQLATGAALLVLELGALNQRNNSQVGFGRKASMADFDTSSSSDSSDCEEVMPKQQAAIIVLKVNLSFISFVTSKSENRTTV